MKPAEHRAAARLRNKRPWLRTGHVTKDGDVISERHGSQVVTQLRALLILLLMQCDGLDVTRIDGHGANRAAEAARKSHWLRARGN